MSEYIAVVAADADSEHQDHDGRQSWTLNELTACIFSVTASSVPPAPQFIALTPPAAPASAFIRDARIAGRSAASAATAVTMTITPDSVGGSNGETPKSIPDSARVNAKDNTRPVTHATPTTRSAFAETPTRC